MTFDPVTQNAAYAADTLVAMLQRDSQPASPHTYYINVYVAYHKRTYIYFTREPFSTPDAAKEDANSGDFVGLDDLSYSYLHTLVFERGKFTVEDWFDEVEEVAEDADAEHRSDYYANLGV